MNNTSIVHGIEYKLFDLNGKMVKNWLVFVSNSNLLEDHIQNVEKIPVPFGVKVLFEKVEFPVVIDGDRSFVSTAQGDIVRIEKIDGVRAFGYIQKQDARGNLKDKTLIHFYTTGHDIRGLKKIF